MSCIFAMTDGGADGLVERQHMRMDGCDCVANVIILSQAITVLHRQVCCMRVSGLYLCFPLQCPFLRASLTIHILGILS